LDRSHQEPIHYGHRDCHWPAFTFRLVQTLLGPLRLLPQGEQVLWLQTPHRVRRCSGERDWGELTKDNHEGENVNPVLLNETLLGLRRNDLALRGERRRGAQLRPRVALDQAPDHTHV